MAETKEVYKSEAQKHWAAIAARPPNINTAHMEANGICCQMYDFSHRPELSEAERRLTLAALHVFQEVSADLNSRALENSRAAREGEGGGA